MTADRQPGEPAGALPARALAASANRRLQAAPSVPAEAREDLLALKSGAVFVCTRPDGDMVAGVASGEGFYADDTRHLSELRLTLGQAPPVLLSSTMESGHHAVVNATNAVLRADGAAIVPQETLNIRRTLLVGGQLHYRVQVRSFRPELVATTVELVLAADFADVFEVRGVERRTTGRVLAARPDGDGVRFAYEAVDGMRRETLVQLVPSPATVRVDGGRAEAVWEVDLPPGQEVVLEATVTPIARGRCPAPRAFARAAGELAAEHDAWVGACASVVCDNDLFDLLLDASMRDLHALMMPVGDGRLPAAGIPWYTAAFGRDSLITACEALMVNPDVARDTLLVLAGLQAHEDEAWRDAEPGKILHELRSGELARTGRIPHTPYYGSVDATPLFLVVAGAYHRWTGDLETMAALRPALDAALGWIDAWGDRDGDGFLEYERRSAGGLDNQGWKDSDDAIVHADGTLAQGPIALVEAQAYAYAGKRGIADVYEALGDRDRATVLRDEAAVLREAFNAAFWDADEGYLVLALDGDKRQVRSVTSNPAHALYCGILDEDKAALVAERLMAPDMFSGWGVRTLSASARAYNPMSYHNGSVWPHDNAIAAAGLKRYGHHAAAARIATGLFDVAAGTRDWRLPELFCGFGRDELRAIVAYPVACIPQAWAAAAPFLLLQTLLGISADAPDRRLTVEQPVLPEWLGAVELSGVRVGRARVSMSFRRGTSGHTGFSLVDQQGDVRVMMAA